MLLRKADNSTAETLAVKSFLRFLALASNPETFPLSELQQAAIEGCTELADYTTEELVEQTKAY